MFMQLCGNKYFLYEYHVNFERQNDGAHNI